MGAVAGGFMALTYDLPQIRWLETYHPEAITRVFSADKILLSELYSERRDPVPLAVIPDYLKKALVTTEDRKFYQHSGVDLKGITRAVVKDIKARQFVEGASTITQQLAKTLFLTPKKDLLRKIKEAILAFQLERRYTKDEILELYLNQVYFGSGAYGVESAARIFFGKPVNQLDLAECALVAGMPKSPSRYSPLVNRALALKRRNTVLKQMHDTGVISDSEYQTAVNEELLTAGGSKNPAKAPYFVEYIKIFLEEELGVSILYKDGLSVYTTLDFELQQAAEKAVANGLAELQNRMKNQNLNHQEPQAALIALDVKTGGILAMVGGIDFNRSAFNRAVSARRQPGSAFKPIVYALAVEKGYSQNMMILDAPIVFKSGKDGDAWKPQNFSKRFKGEMTMRHALAISQNIPAVRLAENLGLESVVSFAHLLGIESHLSPYLSLALGTSEVTLLELVSSYAVFANKGERAEPISVTEIVDRQDRAIWKAKTSKRIVMSRAGAAITTNMLEGVIINGTGRKARLIKHPIAGKTGTTNNYKDALFIGFSPGIAVGVWVGQDLGDSLGQKETGAKAALPIWIDFMSAALDNTPHQYFDIPDDVIQTRINPETGKPASDGSPNAVNALFVKGTEPRG